MFLFTSVQGIMNFVCTEQLTKQLQRERQKLRDIQGSAVQSSTQAQAIKDLEEQIRDLQV